MDSDFVVTNTTRQTQANTGETTSIMTTTTNVHNYGATHKSSATPSIRSSKSSHDGGPDTEQTTLLPSSSVANIWAQQHETPPSSNEETTDEQSPLLRPSQDETTATPIDENDDDNSDTTSSGRKRSSSSWPLWKKLCLFTTVFVLVLLAIPVIILATFREELVKSFVTQATIINIKSVSLDSLSSNSKAVNIRVKASFGFDASRVEKSSVRNIGRLATGVVRKVYINDDSSVELALPDYSDDNLARVYLVGGLEVDVRDGRMNELEFVSEVMPGRDEQEVEKVAKKLVDEIVSGKGMDRLRVKGDANVGLKSGIFSLGKQRIQQTLVLDGISNIPAIDIGGLKFTEVDLSGRTALGVDVQVSVAASNLFPFEFTVPSLSYSILLPACTDGYLEIATATSAEVSIRPDLPIVVDIKGLVSEISDEMTRACRDTKLSPIDQFLGSYLRGKDGKLYVRGALAGDDSPKWLVGLLGSLVVPVVFPGGPPLDDLIKTFALKDVAFKLPPPSAPEDSPEALPRFSASVDAIVAMPDYINVNVNISSVLANADLFYLGRKFGEFHVQHWTPARTRVLRQNGGQKEVEILARFSDVPMNITSSNVFSEVVQKLLFGGGKGVKLDLKGTTDVKVEAAQLGVVVVRDIPVKGSVVVKGGDPSQFALPKANGITITSTTPHSVSLSSNITFYNPTNYTAVIPYVNLQYLHNGSILGNGTVRNLNLSLGHNTATVHGIWSPLDDGDHAVSIGRDLLGAYVSGKNTTITIRPHKLTIPSLPSLSKSFSNISIEIPTPKLSSHTKDPKDDDPSYPGDPDIPDDDPNKDSTAHHFIRSATLHLLSSTGTFILDNPISNIPIYILSINGTASHEGTLLGTIDYHLPMNIPPGVSESTRVPVSWTLRGVGYDILRRAVGGVLKVDAVAVCEVQVGRWMERIRFEGGGIGAFVRL